MWNALAGLVLPFWYKGTEYVSHLEDSDNMEFIKDQSERRKSHLMIKTALMKLIVLSGL